MPNNHARFGAPEGLYVTGAVFFTLVLMLSALWDASIRWLHLFQASMYIATLVLGLRKNRWGYFIGISAAGLWDYLNIFATTFFFNGLHELSQWIHTGHLNRPDQLIAVPAWCSNLLVVLGCAWAFTRLEGKSLRDGARLVVAFVLTTGFFVLDIALFQPRYLPLLSRMLHPHLP